jgi:hypothetical protein
MHGANNTVTQCVSNCHAIAAIAAAAALLTPQDLKRFCKSLAEASQYLDLSDVTQPVDIQTTAVRGRDTQLQHCPALCSSAHGACRCE